MRYILSLLLLACLCVSCKQRQAAAEATGNLLTTASTLQISRQGDCSVVRITSPHDSTVIFATYIFPDTDTTAAPSIAGATVLTPSQLKRLMVYSSVHASALKELGALDHIKVIGDAEYFTLPEIKKGIEAGTVIDGGTQQQPITERIMAASPGAVIISHYDGIDESGIERLGIPVIYMCESQEEHPLGRAEWIKFLGLIAGNTHRADSIFSAVEANYNKLCHKTNAVKKRPKVLTETMYQGVWNVAGGKSYAATMIKDAGGDYAWKDDDSTGSLVLPFESVFAKAADADVWLVRVFGVDLSMDYLRKSDERYMLFDPAKHFREDGKGIWACNTTRVPFYEQTPFHPDMLLADYIYIFHPDLMPGYTPRYFNKVTH